MKYLRQCGLKDPEIGEFMGISRERVAQLIGRVRLDADWQENEREQLDSVKAMLKNGLTMAEIEREVGNSNLWTWLSARKVRYADYATQRLERRKQQVIKDISRMLEAGIELNTYNLERVDGNLYTRAMKVMGIKEWKKYFEDK